MDGGDGRLKAQPFYGLASSRILPRPMRDKLPEQIDPRRLAHQAARLAGVVPAADLPRLGAAFGVEGNAGFELAFGLSPSGRTLVTGEITVPIAATCQRCLQAYVTTLHADVDLEIGESPRDAEQDFELVLRPDERLDLRALIEDELLLAAPMIALHASGECAMPADTGDARTAADGDRRKPFAGLQALRERPQESPKK